MKTPSIHMRDVMKNVVLKVRIKMKAQYRIRIWIAVRIIKLAGVVLGCGIKFVEKEDEG